MKAKLVFPDFGNLQLFFHNFQLTVPNFVSRYLFYVVNVPLSYGIIKVLPTRVFIDFYAKINLFYPFGNKSA